VEIDVDLIKRAQMLTFMEYSLSEVEDILLNEGYPDKQIKELVGSTEEALDNLIPDKMKTAYQPVKKSYGEKTKLVKLLKQITKK
jgi:hypothetical protein